MPKPIINGMKLLDDRTVYYLDGKEVSEGEYHQVFPKPAVGKIATPKSCAAWPQRSDALAVHPDQVAEANERNRQHGISARYESDGTCVIPDRGERRKLMKIEGFHDRDGGYGDG